MAPLDDSSLEDSLKKINYNVNKYADDFDLIKQGRFRTYAEKQCMKIADYMQKVRSTEILHMECQFLHDEQDNVWLSYASKIQFRKCTEQKSLAEMLDLKQGNQ